MSAAKRAPAAMLLPFILFLVFFFVFQLVLVLVEILVVEIFIFVFVVVLGRKLQRRNPADAQIRAALLTNQRVAFVQFFFIDVDDRVTHWTIDHLLPSSRRALPKRAPPLHYFMYHDGGGKKVTPERELQRPAPDLPWSASPASFPGPHPIRSYTLNASPPVSGTRHR